MQLLSRFTLYIRTMPKAKEKKVTKKIVKKVDLVDTDTNEVMSLQTDQPKEVILEKTETNSQVMTKKNWISDVKVTPTIVDVQSGKIHVKAINNNGSFKSGQEYFVSQKMFQNYQGNFEIIE